MNVVVWLYRLIGRFRLYQKDRFNKARLAACGSNTVIDGLVDARGLTCEVHVGRDCLIHGQLVTETAEASIVIGNNVFIGAQTIVDCFGKIVIEDDVLISYQCLVMDSDGHDTRPQHRVDDLAGYRARGETAGGQALYAPVRIGRGAWIGARSIILKGVTIGPGAVVGAGSVVTKSVDAFTIVAGNPARLVREVRVDAPP